MGLSATSHVDAAIVGAGIAGLVTATRLIEAGVSCAVLESQDRVGGRLLTHYSSAGRFDLGATWYWPGETRVAALIEELQIPTHAHHLAGDAMYHVPGGAQRMDGNPIDVVSGRFSDGASSLAERLADRLGDTVSLRTTVHEVAYSESELNGQITKAPSEHPTSSGSSRRRCSSHSSTTSTNTASGSASFAPTPSDSMHRRSHPRLDSERSTTT